MNPTESTPTSLGPRHRDPSGSPFSLLRVQGFAIAAVLVSLLFTALPMVAAAFSEAHIAELTAKIEDKKILASFRLHEGFGPAVLERVQSGLPTSFEYRIELVHKRRMWWDKALVVSEIQVVAMYSAVTEEYLINFKQDGKLVNSRVVHDTTDLKDTMTFFEDFAISGIEVLPEEGHIRIRVRALLGSKTIMSFIPKDIHTDWAESPLLALPEALSP